MPVYEVEVGGRVFEVDAPSFTVAIRTAKAQMATPPPAAMRGMLPPSTPETTQETPYETPAERERRFTGEAGTQIADVGRGAVAGLMKTGFHGGDVIRRALGMERVIETPEAQAAMTAPASAGGRLGMMAEQAAEFIAPGVGVARATKAVPWFGRTMAQAGTAAGVAGAQTGGDPASMITAAGLGAGVDTAARVAGAGLRGVSRAAAGAREGGLGGAMAGMIRTVAPGEPKTMMVQAIKPRATNVNFARSLDRAMPEIKAVETAGGKAIQGIDDLATTITAAKRQVRSQLDQMAGPKRAAGWQVDLSGVADAMETSIPRKLQIENPEAALRLRNSAQVYRQAFSLEDAEQLLKETNAEMEAFYNKYPISQRRALTADPEWARLNAQAQAMRTAIYQRLDEEGGGAAARELQRRYGALLDVETEVARRSNVAKRQQPESLSEQLSTARAAMSIARGVYRAVRGLDPVGGMADIVGGVAMRDTAKFMREQQTTDALIRRAMAGFKGQPTPVPLPAQRPIRGQLGPGARPMPPVQDPSGGRGVSAWGDVQYSGRPRQLPEAPEPRRVFEMPGEIQPDQPSGRLIPAAPIDYAIDPTVTVKAGGVRVKQFAGDPEAVAAAVATPEVRQMLKTMLEDLDTFQPTKGRLIRTAKGDPTSEVYSYGAPGSGVADDIRVISEQNVGHGEIGRAIQDLLAGRAPTNRLHTAALDAAMGYLEKRPGYHAPSIPSEFVPEDTGFEAFSEAVESVRGKRRAKSSKRTR